LHQIFTFDFMAAPWDAGRLKAVIEATVAGLQQSGAPATWALSNHDSPRVVTRLGGGQEGLHRARALALVAHALPGSVYVYQGEELGLPDVDLPDDARQDPVFLRTGGEQKGRDGARVPIPWSGDAAPYGFGSSRDTWLPMPDGWSGLTVEAQRRNPSSTLNQYRTMLRLRHELPDLVDPGLSVHVHDGDVLVIRRGHRFACVVNCGADPQASPVLGDLLVSSDGR
jgi:alpha-glucosidase